MSSSSPRRNVRLRLMLIYGALFLASGAALLTITYVLVSHNTGPVLLRATTTSSQTEIERVRGQQPSTPPGLPPDVREQMERAKANAAEQRRHDLNQLLMQSGIALGLMTVTSLGLGWVMAGRALRPLESAFEAQRRFVANASHELRTPLTMMRTSLDVAAGKPGPVPPQVGALQAKLREGLDRADRLLEGLLALAHAQHRALPEQATASLPEMVSAAIEHRSGAIADRGIGVRQELAPAAVTGSEPLLSRMVENVIDNAIRHNEPQGWVRVGTRTDGDLVRLVVDSGGPRLAERDVQALARPFQRLGAERTGSENGAGLGLSIVEAIASAHGGRLALKARTHGGLSVQIDLPSGGSA